MKKQGFKLWMNLLFGVVLVLSISLSSYGIYSFMQGSHNIDLGQNLMKINEIGAPYGLTFTDINSNRNSWSAQDMYISGNQEIKQSLALISVGMFFAGVAVTGLLKTN